MRRNQCGSFFGVLAALLLALTGTDADAKSSKPKGKQAAEDPYAAYVWPPPPDEPKVKLEAVIAGRSDVEATSRFRRRLLGASPQSRYDRLHKPHAVAFDDRGRLLVTDSALGALIRFDRAERRMDVFGTKGALPLRLPLGLSYGPGDRIYVADAELKRVLAFDSEGKVLAVYGREGDLSNPTDAAVAPDGGRLFVTDSKAHRIVVFDLETGKVASSFGQRGHDAGQFLFPSSLAFSPEGELYVVDQLNARVQVLDEAGEFLDQFGGRGVGFANFVRPKDIAIDGIGYVYVADNAFNNVQLFDADLTLLTFVGAAGTSPGQFFGASGVASRGDQFAVVDQLGRRLQLFRFLQSRRP